MDIAEVEDLVKTIRNRCDAALIIIPIVKSEPNMARLLYTIFEDNNWSIQKLVLEFCIKGE